MQSLADPRTLAARARIQRLSHWLDGGFRVPGTRLRFGLESLLGLLPVVGDLAGLLLSLWLLLEARRAGAPPRLLARMAANALLDAGAGALPVVGDLFDVLFKANARNADLLRDHFEPELRQSLPGASRWPPPLAALLSLAALAAWWWMQHGA